MYRYYLSIHPKNRVDQGTFNNLNDIQNPISNAKLNQINSVNTDIINKSDSNENTSQQSFLPNFNYSPFTSPNMSPDHRLYPHGAAHSHSYSNNLSSLHNTTQRDAIFDRSEEVTLVKQYHVREQLGRGSYGLVQLAFNQENSTFYAMKSLSKKKLMKSFGLFNRPVPLRKSTSSNSSSKLTSFQTPIDPLQKIYKEIAIHKKLSHPNIVKLIEVLDDPSQQFLYMVFEYVENGAVMQIGKDSAISESRAKKYFIDSLLGLEYLHYQKIIHRDIKPANLLLSKDDHIKIADFGVSNEFTGDDVYLTSTAGSPAFMAPESVQNSEQPFTGKALDIWALGITLYAFLFATIPFENFNRYLLYQMIINNPIVFPESHKVSDEVISLLKTMLDKNPLTRIRLLEIKVHDWVTQFGLIPLCSEKENCGNQCIDVTEDEVANSIRQIPRIETVMKVKMLLKNKSFRNPKKCGSVSKLDSLHNSTTDDRSKSLSKQISDGSITSVHENK